MVNIYNVFAQQKNGRIGFYNVFVQQNSHEICTDNFCLAKEVFC